MEREPDFKGHCTVLSVRVRTRACSSLTDQVTPLISSRFARKLALNAVPVSSALPSSKERPAQSPPPTRLRRRAVAPAAVRCVQFSGAWRMGLGGLGHSRSRGRAASGPAQRLPPGWACGGRRLAPALSHELAQACVPGSGRLPPVPGAWRRAALEGRSVGEAGKRVTSCPGDRPSGRGVGGRRGPARWASGHVPPSAEPSPRPAGAPVAAPCSLGTRTPSPGRSCAGSAEVRRQL